MKTKQYNHSDKSICFFSLSHSHSIYQEYSVWIGDENGNGI